MCRWNHGRMENSKKKNEKFKQSYQMPDLIREIIKRDSNGHVKRREKRKVFEVIVTGPS